MVTKLKVQVVSVVLVLSMLGVSAHADMGFELCETIPVGEEFTELSDLSSFSRTGNFTEYFKNTYGHFSDFHFKIHSPTKSIGAPKAPTSDIFKIVAVTPTGPGTAYSNTDWTVDFVQGKGKGIPKDTFFKISVLGGLTDLKYTIHPTPIPGAALLGVIGLGVANWRLRRRETS